MRIQKPFGRNFNEATWTSRGNEAKKLKTDEKEVEDEDKTCCGC